MSGPISGPYLAPYPDPYPAPYQVSLLPYAKLLHSNVQLARDDFNESSPAPETTKCLLLPLFEPVLLEGRSAWARLEEVLVTMQPAYQEEKNLSTPNADSRFLDC